MSIRRNLRALGVAAPLCLAVVAGCGGEDDDQAGASIEAAVPDGVAWQYATIEAEVAAEGGEAEAGPWRIAYIVEPAEAWFEDGRFRPPAKGETQHIEIIPIEAETGRVVPDVPIRAEVRDAQGRVVDARELEFYYAEFFHYANNFSIPKAGEYTLRATIEPPTFRRHGDEADGPALAEGATVEFDGVELGPES